MKSWEFYDCIKHKIVLSTSSMIVLRQKLQNRAARIITRADYSIRTSDVLNSLEWPNLEERSYGV